MQQNVTVSYCQNPLHNEQFQNSVDNNNQSHGPEGRLRGEGFIWAEVDQNDLAPLHTCLVCLLGLGGPPRYALLRGKESKCTPIRPFEVKVQKGYSHFCLNQLSKDSLLTTSTGQRKGSMAPHTERKRPCIQGGMNEKGRCYHLYTETTELFTQLFPFLPDADSQTIFPCVSCSAIWLNDQVLAMECEQK